MKWLQKLLGQKGVKVVVRDTEAAKEAQQLKETLDGQAAEIKKLTHSLYHGRMNNHLTQAILKSMRSTR